MRTFCTEWRDILRAFRRDRRASITILSAFVLPVVIGVGALVAEFGHGLLTKTENQRVADIAAWAGALAYNSTSSTTSMNSAIASVAALNGLPSSAVTGSLVTSPSGSGNQAVTVTVATTDYLFLARVLGQGASLPVSSASYAEIAPAQSTGCIIALDGSKSGVSLTGGTTITAAGCTVASNASVSVPCGTTITAKSVSYNTTAPTQGCNGIKGPTGGAAKIVKAAVPDPLAGNAGVAAAVARFGSIVSRMTSPAAPSAPSVTTGTDINFGYSTPTDASAKQAGCTSATFANGTWTLKCPAGGTYNFGTITIGGGITVDFNSTTSSASTTYNFSSMLSLNVVAMKFGSGNYNFAKGLSNSGSSKTSFGAGTFTIGGGTGSACGGTVSICNTGSGTLTFGSGTFKLSAGISNSNTTTFGAGTFSLGGGSACSGTFSICNSGTLTFGGPSTFALSAGISNGGSGIVTLGSGTTNTFAIGSSSPSAALDLQGSAKTYFADAVGSTFQVNGNVNASGGGTCLTISQADQHDFNGSFASAGGTILGSGTYSVNGYVGLGVNGGGDVYTCATGTVGMSGSNVTLVISGSSTIPSSASSACAGQAFCIGAGYQHVTLTAPTSGAMTSLAVIGPASLTGGASFTAGASGTSFSGALYFPKGPVTLSGGASLGSGPGQCLEVIGSLVSLSGGTAVASTCAGLGASSSSGGAIVLVQ